MISRLSKSQVNGVWSSDSGRAPVIVKCNGSIVKSILMAAPTLQNMARNQVDITLDGGVHVVRAKSGIGACSLTFMEDLERDCSNTKSAIEQFLQGAKSTESVIKIYIYKAGGGIAAEFEGIVTNVKVAIQGGSAEAPRTATVSCELLGVWDD